MKIGIIGCGKIADQHATQIQRISDCKIVSACDQDLLMARQLADRFSISNVYKTVTDMLEDVKLDVVHITTPPQWHYKIGKQCLKAGVNVYIEKPFTVNFNEAKELINLAKSKELKITVGHNIQFSQESRIMRDLVNNGFLGGIPVHMESIFCYDLQGSNAKSFLRNKKHWVRQLPGTLLHNLISHGISKIVEFLPEKKLKILVDAFVSPLLKEMGETNILDELRVIINANNVTTAYFTFSSRIRPHQNIFYIYGPKNTIIVDQIHQSVIKVPNKNYKAQLNYFIPLLNYSKQYLSGSSRNIFKFIKRDLHLDAGLKFLIESFYHSIKNNNPPPIPYREILLTTKIMDDIFNQVQLH